MTTTENAGRRSDGAGVAQIDFGILEQRVPSAAHVAYFWETQQEFIAAVRFLETGLRGNDHCVVFGYEEANRAVCGVLEKRGFDLSDLQAKNRLSVLGGNPMGQAILETIGADFQRALDNGAQLMRLLGNIGWGKRNWPDDHDLLAFEAKVTEAAKKFPCVVVCMYDTPSLSGHVLHHGGFETHPHLMIGPGALRENPFYVPTELFLQRVEAIAAEIAERRRAEMELRGSEDRFRALFDHSNDAVLLTTPEGTIEAANPEACRMFGRTEDEIRQVGRAGLVDETDPRLALFLQERERTGRVQSELTLRRRDGTKFLGEVSSAFYKDWAGATKASVIIRDITERKRAEETLRDITEGTAGSTGDDFFRSLTQRLAHALEVRYCFVAECTDKTKTRVRTLAFWAGNSFADDVEYPLRGTPCETVIAGTACAYPDRLQELFPEDKDLVALGAQSYAAVPAVNLAKEVLGHLVVIDNKPRVFGDREFSILRIFATRVGVELERKHAEQALKGSEERLRLLLDINHAIGRHLNRDELFGALAGCLNTLVPTERFGIELPIEGDKLQGHILSTIPTGGEPTQPTVLPALGTACNWVMENRAGFVAASRDEFRERFPVTFDVMSSQGMESLCALPLVSGDRARGALFFMAGEKGVYGHLRREFLEQVAIAVAVALDDCLAHEEVRSLRDRLAAENVYLQEEIKTEHNFEEIIGQSAPVRQLLRKVEQVAPTESTVLIQGETGTGKELLARAIHDRSRRKDRPLVKVNCGSIPSGLVESELFGHEKGAFTGATQRRIGRFELASGGTLFLDEVTELPIDTQVKLLRVLQEGEFERVGSSQTIRVDVRVIAATNRNLKEVVADGSFRSDLFYRLNVFPLEVPPLRARREDIPLLVNFLLSKFARKLGKEIRGVAQKSMDGLTNYPWPGNVRELQNVVERAVILAAGPIVTIDETLVRSDGAAQEPSLNTLENNERHHIIRALDQTNWVIHGKKGAAELLGINPSTLRSRIEKLGIKKPSRASAAGR